jgi:hypothetical protein
MTAPGQTEPCRTAAGVAAPPSKPDATAHRRQPPGGTFGVCGRFTPDRTRPLAALTAEMGQDPPPALQKRLGQGETCSPDRDRLP